VAVTGGGRQWQGWRRRWGHGGRDGRRQAVASAREEVVRPRRARARRRRRWWSFQAVKERRGDAAAHPVDGRRRQCRGARGVFHGAAGRHLSAEGHGAPDGGRSRAAEYHAAGAHHGSGRAHRAGATAVRWARPCPTPTATVVSRRRAPRKRRASHFWCRRPHARWHLVAPAGPSRANGGATAAAVKRPSGRRRAAAPPRPPPRGGRGGGRAVQGARVPPPQLNTPSRHHLSAAGT